MTPKKELQQLIIEGIQNRKGRKTTIVDMSHIESAAARKFIIAEGTSTMHASGVADSVLEYVLKEGGIKPYNIDGLNSTEWIVIDYGDIWVHIFVPEARMRYNLEELWSDARVTDVPDLD